MATPAAVYSLEDLLFQRVRIHGLAARPELNGRVGTARRFNAEKQRWEVYIQEETGGVSILVRPDRLLRCSDADQ
eukprot:3883117-Prymnesium_polylepis.1